MGLGNPIINSLAQVQLAVLTLVFVGRRGKVEMYLGLMVSVDSSRYSQFFWSRTTLLRGFLRNRLDFWVEET